MDLNKRLLVWLSSLAVLWLLGTLAYTGLSLRQGVVDEMAGARSVIDLLDAAAEARSGGAAEQLRLQLVLAEDAPRHLMARWADEPPPRRDESGASWAHALARALAPALPPAHEHRIAIGPRTLVIAPMPDSEIDEVLGDALPLLALLIAAGAAMLGGVWWIVRRALAPAAKLCEGLARLEAGHAAPAFPPFELREYAAIAAGIERLAHGLAAAHDRQSRLAQRLIGLQECERRELARDLHDEFGQYLTAMAATVSLLQRHAARMDAARIADCATQLGDGLRCVGGQLRGLLSRMRPHGLDASTLPHEVRTMAERAPSRLPGLAVDVEVAEPLPPLREDAALALYRALQEATTNVLRHSGAATLRIALDVPRPDGVRLRVCDDGCGRVESDELLRVHGRDMQDRVPGSGLGLLGMRERLRMVGGRLSLENNLPRGLCVEAWVPTASSAAGASTHGGSVDPSLAA